MELDTLIISPTLPLSILLYIARYGLGNTMVHHYTKIFCMETSYTRHLHLVGESVRIPYSFVSAVECHVVQSFLERSFVEFVSAIHRFPSFHS